MRNRLVGVGVCLIGLAGFPSGGNAAPPDARLETQAGKAASAKV